LDEHAPSSNAGHDDAEEHAHEEHQHSDANANSLELSARARGNIGLTPEYLQPVSLQTYRRSFNVPGIVVERPGITVNQVSTPMAGVVTHVHAVEGEAVIPGDLLFRIRITAEELVESQTELLKSVGSLEIENREIARLMEVTRSGAVAQKTLLQRQYAKQKLESLINAQREALRLHGLSEQQISDIEIRRRLLRELTIVAPDPDSHSLDGLRLSAQDVHPASHVQELVEADTTTSRAGNAAKPGPHPPLILQSVSVQKGQTVDAGQSLCVIADYSELYIEGLAFEQDVDVLAQSAQKGWSACASIPNAESKCQRLENLQLVYSSSKIDADSRTLSFYVRLPNELTRDTTSDSGHRFVDWKYRPGQRLQLQVPAEEWKDQIVLPVEAVAHEGVETFVFVQNGDRFDRVSVEIRHSDTTTAVIANNGAIFPGDVVAMRGAHQMQIALKNKSGGGADPHAGHNH
jgi:multidrug efflux pump subunit AcrA (membrane-fusion protein)